MPDDAQAVFQEITDELVALRAAILENDLGALDLHTAKMRAKLSQLAPLLTQSPPSLARTLHSLAGQIRSTRSLLESARRTVQALNAVYRSIYDSHEPLLPERH